MYTGPQLYKLTHYLNKIYYEWSINASYSYHYCLQIPAKHSGGGTEYRARSVQ